MSDFIIPLLITSLVANVAMFGYILDQNKFVNKQAVRLRLFETDELCEELGIKTKTDVSF